MQCAWEKHDNIIAWELDISKNMAFSFSCPRGLTLTRGAGHFTNSQDMEDAVFTVQAKMLKGDI